MTHYTASHWGIYEVEHKDTVTTRLKPLAADPDPSPIGLSMLDACTAPARVAKPAVRKSMLDAGIGAAPERRGLDPFVEIDWDLALDLAAAALKQTIAQHGNQAIFGGSYGWASAGRFHHTQSQIHRFLNAIGGYVRHTESYSLGAAHVVMEYLVASMRELTSAHTSWDVLRDHTRLFVCFGGVPLKNAQVSPGGAGRHGVREALREMTQRGVRFINVGPVGDNLETGCTTEWLPIRPNTDTALMLALAYTLYDEGLHDAAFLQSHCVGFARFARYLTGVDDNLPKSPAWAEPITGAPAARIAELAREMARTRTMVTVAWSLQRSHHGEQPYWMVVTLAAMLGQIGLPGGGFGVGYGALNMIGSTGPRFSGPALPQGRNPVNDFIPCARIADMLDYPGTPFTYRGKQYLYPHIDLIYWAGGNPFHHHQDLNRLTRVWRKPSTVIVHEPFWTATAKMADIVLPATTTLERDDIAQSTRERYMVAMKSVLAPIGEARNDYAIFSALARRLGALDTFTEGLCNAQWLARLYEDSRTAAAEVGIEMPSFAQFWESGLLDLARPDSSVIMLEQFRADPVAHPLRTPSGKIELYSETLAGFGNDDCQGHARWYEPAEWLGSPKAREYPLHLVSDQPTTRLHSQLDHSSLSRANKIQGREPITLHPVDATARGIADGNVVRVFNARGACLAGARLSTNILPGVVRMSTGAWYDPEARDQLGSLDKHGNPNVLTLDIPASSLSQGCAAQTCLVQIERFEGMPPSITAFDPPFIMKFKQETNLDDVISRREALQPLLDPRSIAVIGASEDQTKFGGRLYKLLLHHGYAGTIFPINPVRETLFGLRTYPSVEALPAPADLAVLTLPVAKVEATIAACTRRGIRAAIIITAKFSDAGPEGLKLEQQIVAIARQHGMRLLGPNCLGLISPASRVALCSSPAVEVERLIEAPIGLISQSGALMGTIFDRAQSMGIGFSHCISVGNQADLELCDFIEFLIDDPKTAVICTYVEGIKSASRFVALAARARSANKPILIVKSGSSPEGSQAAYSHTASLAGDFAVLQAVCRRENVIVMDDPFAMLVLASAMVRYPGKPARNAAILTISGGAGAIAADRLSHSGIPLARFTEVTRARLAGYYPPGQAGNPVDIGARGNETETVGAATAQIVLADPNTDLALSVMTTAPDVLGLTADLVEGSAHPEAQGKPLLHILMPGQLANRTRAMLAERQLPYVDSLADGVAVLQAWKRWSDYRVIDPAVRPAGCQSKFGDLAGELNEACSKAVLAEAGIATNTGVIVQTIEQACRQANELGYPLVLKVVSPDIVHKSDVGGVALDIADTDDLVRRFVTMQAQVKAAVPNARIDGYSLQIQASGELELIIGAKSDPQFGPIVIVGAGGVIVELLKDIAVLPVPVAPEQAYAALRQLQIGKLLEPYRGRGALDVDAVVDVIVRLGWLAHDLAARGDAADFEIEVNPLKVGLAGHGAIAVDARARVGPARQVATEIV